MILRIERCDDVFMKNMKILILHKLFIDFGENPAAVSNQPGARQATSGPRERETQREPFAVAFGKKRFFIHHVIHSSAKIIIDICIT